MSQPSRRLAPNFVANPTTRIDPPRCLTSKPKPPRKSAWAELANFAAFVFVIGCALAFMSLSPVVRELLP